MMWNFRLCYNETNYGHYRNQHNYDRHVIHLLTCYTDFHVLSLEVVIVTR